MYNSTKNPKPEYEEKSLEQSPGDSSLDYLLPEWLVELRKHFKYSKNKF